ncbi:hypothetical protein PoB_004074900 [Plakobranchus ocellatus]|uniref:Uncharacterized protein n=1 Tax=Plakobranchus ocellatus TaxID=259542 RepID=A0AAV4B6C8_9GAST|nr:hypothetical protein PoB_004074900 [Plakobranchus ocellatus]
MNVILEISPPLQRHKINWCLGHTRERGGKTLSREETVHPLRSSRTLKKVIKSIDGWTLHARCDTLGTKIGFQAGAAHDLNAT